MRKTGLTFLMILLLCSCSTNTQTSSSPSKQIDSKTVTYKTEAKKLSKLMEAIPTIESIVKGQTKAKKGLANLSHRNANDDEVVYDYTEYDPPVHSAHALALCCNSAIDGLFSMDDRIESSLFHNENVLDTCAYSYNQWLDYLGDKQCRVNYNPAFNRLKIEIKEQWYEGRTSVDCYYTYVVGTNQDEKVYFNMQSIMNYVENGIRYYPRTIITYLEDAYFTNFSSTFNESGDLMYYEYSELNFNDKLLRSYTENVSNPFSESLEGCTYSEMPYDSDVMPVYCSYVTSSENNNFTDLGMIYNKDYVPIVDLPHNVISLYYFDGIESITSPVKIELNEDSERNPFIQNLPLTVTTKTGKTINNGDIDSVSFGAIAYYNPYGEKQIIVPCFVADMRYDNFFDLLKNDYDLEIRENINSIVDDWINHNNAFQNNRSDIIEKITVLREKGLRLYQPIGKDNWDYMISSENLSQINPNGSTGLIESTLNGEATINNNEIDLSNISLHLSEINDFGKYESAYVDYYLYSDLDRYIIGSEKIDYSGEETDVSLKGKITLDRPLYNQGQYYLVAVVRNRGDSIHYLKANSVGENQGFFKYELSDNKEILVDVSYSTSR